jgi:predicted O-methyltransferase YrrM
MSTWLQRLRTWLGGSPPADAATVAAWIAEIRAANLSYCGPPKLENIAEAMLSVRAARVRGRYLEAGVALGGSAILIGRMKPPGAPLDLYDVFAMIPPPGASDGEDAHRRYEEIRAGRSAGLGGNTYYGYMDDLHAQVIANLQRFGLDPRRHAIDTHPGLFEDTLHPRGPVAFAHVDCDWYDSVRVCIERIGPQLAPGGMIVFDDYSSYSGCKRAVDEWLARDRALTTVFHRRSLALRRLG